MGTLAVGNNGSDALGAIRRELDEFALPSAMRKQVHYHCDDLAKLTATLQKLGLDDREIDHHVIELFKSYRTELLRNAERMISA